jgi:chromosome transmission fidelity protein 4
LYSPSPTLPPTSQAYTRGLAYDPEGEFVAATSADGSLAVWRVGGAGSTPEYARRRACARVAPAAPRRLAPSWHPDGGALLAVPGPEGEVALLERLSWRDAGALAGGHAGAVLLCAFSPNGLYLATAGEDRALLVWDVGAAKVLARRALPAAAAGLAWRPGASANALAVVTEGGELALWAGAVPSQLPGPGACADAAAAAAAAAEELLDAEAGVASDDEDEEEDGEEEEEEEEAEGDADDNTALKRGPLYRSKARRPLPRAPRAAPAPEPQPPVQPGATRLDAGRRFLAYNALGAITLRAEEGGHNVVEVSFHDTALHRRRVPLLNDFFGFALGALGEAGAAYAAPGGADAPPTLLYRPFEPWAANTEWQAALPAGEEPLCLAAGAEFVAAATAERRLRLFSGAGLPLAVLALPGAPVALAAAGRALAVAHHVAPPGAAGDQALAYSVYDVPEQRLLHAGPLPLSPGGAELAWLGFTEEGALAVYDSVGELFVRTPTFGGAWAPLFSAAAERKGAESFWLFSVAAARGEAMAIVCAGAGEPPVPSGGARPVVSALRLRVPGAAPAGADDALTPLEGEFMRAALVAAEAAAAAAAGGGDAGGADAAALEAAAGAAAVAADKAGVRLFAKLVQADRAARALEVAGRLATPAAVRGAAAIAHHRRARALGDHVLALLERRETAEANEVEAQAMAAAAAAAGGGGAPAPAGGYAAAGGAYAYEAPPARGPSPPAAPAAPASMFARRAPAENGGAAGNGGEAGAPKRKAGGANPFARKKVAPT